MSTHVISKRNGLKITMPVDARNVVHRFMIAGGGNELVFEPLTRSKLNESRAAEPSHLAMGGADTDEPEAPKKDGRQRVELTEHVIEDEDEAPAKPAPKKTATKRTAPKKDVSEDVEL